MHPNPIFHTRSDAANLAFAREVSFGILALSAEGLPLISHLPFLLNEAGTEVEVHIVRSNPVARALRDGPLPAKLIVSGPDGYVSPDWYGLEDQVPTWNYVAVHLSGTIELLDPEEMPGVLTRLSDQFETRLRPKTPWVMDKMTKGVAERMMRQILPARMQVTGVDGTWKLSQNKPESARLGAAEGVSDPALAALMRSPPEG
ncbi:FMN-binding negative transcriptional regulator [Pseudooceanicola sp. 502str34]